MRAAMFAFIRVLASWHQGGNELDTNSVDKMFKALVGIRHGTNKMGGYEG